ncbi:MAG: GspH/FimT family pseudopilin [Vicinamibacterales bacterium]
MSGAAARPRAAGGAPGAALIDIVAALGLAGVMMAVAVPALSAVVPETEARLAARYLAARFQHARLEALKRNANVGVVFAPPGDPFGFVLAVDANGNGVRRREVDDGGDPVIQPRDRLADHWPRVAVAVRAALPGIDGGAAVQPAPDGVRFGASRMVVFSPLGGATSGTLYLTSSAGGAYAVRVTGTTGRVRAWRLDAVARQWHPL